MTRSVVRLSILACLVAAWAAGCTAVGQIPSGDGEGTTVAEPQPVGTFDAAPLLGELTSTVVYGEIWERPQLSKRDRSLVTIAALQALYRDQLRGHINRGLENGLTPEEIQEVIVHVSFYTGWPTGVNASRMAGEVFRDQGLPPIPSVPTWVESPVSQEYTTGAYAAVPRLGELRNSLLYGDIWERSQLSKRDRSMVTDRCFMVLSPPWNGISAEWDFRDSAWDRRPVRPASMRSDEIRRGRDRRPDLFATHRRGGGVRCARPDA